MLVVTLDEELFPNVLSFSFCLNVSYVNMADGLAATLATDMTQGFVTDYDMKVPSTTP